MPQLTTFIKTVEVKDLDTNKYIFNIKVYKTNENNIRGYVCITLSGKEISTPLYFMDCKPISEVRALFKKYIRENKINIYA